MVSAANPTSPSSQQNKRGYWLAIPTMVIAVAVLIGVFIALHTAAEPGSWYRTLTGKYLTLAEPPQMVRVGTPSDFPDEGVYTHRSASDGIWIVRFPESKLVALSTLCASDGCATDWVTSNDFFKCPCCGSEYATDGTVIRGPAIRRLERFKIDLQRGWILVNRSAALRYPSGEWPLPLRSAGGN